MKTVDTDIAAFLRRNENLELRLHFDGKRFHVKSPSIEQHAAYLSDALEHTAEEYRRRANAMDPIRDDGRGKTGDRVKAPTVRTVTVTAKVTPPKSPPNIVWTIGQPVTFPATAIAPVPQYPMCGVCNSFPSYGIGTSPIQLVCSSCGAKWSHATVKGSHIDLRGQAPGVYEFDGATWNKVTP